MLQEFSLARLLITLKSVTFDHKKKQILPVNNTVVFSTSGAQVSRTEPQIGSLKKTNVPDCDISYLFPFSKFIFRNLETQAETH